MSVHTARLVLAGLLAAAPVAGISQSTDTSIAPAQTGTDAQTDTMSTAEAAAPIEGQIVMQGPNSVLARDLIGARVYTGTDETVGDINNLIITLDGTVEGAVIGVGGFLGMGEKDVAIEMSALSLLETAPGKVHLVLASSPEELAAAPAFRSLYQQQLDAEAERAAAPAPGASVPSN